MRTGNVANGYNVSDKLENTICITWAELGTMWFELGIRGRPNCYVGNWQTGKKPALQKKFWK